MLTDDRLVEGDIMARDQEQQLRRELGFNLIQAEYAGAMARLVWDDDESLFQAGQAAGRAARHADPEPRSPQHGSTRSNMLGLLL